MQNSCADAVARAEGSAPQSRNRNTVAAAVLGPIGLVAFSGGPLLGAAIGANLEPGAAWLLGAIGALFGLFIGMAINSIMLTLGWLGEELSLFKSDD